MATVITNDDVFALTEAAYVKDETIFQQNFRVMTEH